MKGFPFLLIAILSETIATSALKSSEEFTKLVPSIVVVVGYLISFYFLSLSLRTIPIGVAYAIWAGLGIVLITLAGIFIFKQVPDLPAVIGLVLILIGVVLINGFSKTVPH